MCDKKYFNGNRMVMAARYTYNNDVTTIVYLDKSDCEYEKIIYDMQNPFQEKCRVIIKKDEYDQVCISNTNETKANYIKQCLQKKSGGSITNPIGTPLNISSSEYSRAICCHYPNCGH
ncbi:hypothetical protein GCL60_09655 [Silvanigrella paludirubra]|uniref:Uncharacterized protein n=1 Tax=Silvanigrella paludirubra TaxID=2499159 RepID=A0A6N6VSZ8_9BACT|nr:hypothetical protein [Silvanigrella paludirubra]KAB8039110.1 hypothetical protein GCL60_09655 [Silvanigrella paludirubra]